MQMLINSQWVESSDQQRTEVRNPASGEVLDTVPRATLDDARRAVEAAQRQNVKELGSVSAPK